MRASHVHDVVAQTALTSGADHPEGELGKASVCIYVHEFTGERRKW